MEVGAGLDQQASGVDATSAAGSDTYLASFAHTCVADTTKAALVVQSEVEKVEEDDDTEAEQGAEEPEVEKEEEQEVDDEEGTSAEAPQRQPHSGTTAELPTINLVMVKSYINAYFLSFNTGLICSILLPTSQDDSNEQCARVGRDLDTLRRELRQAGLLHRFSTVVVPHRDVILIKCPNCESVDMTSYWEQSVYMQHLQEYHANTEVTYVFLVSISLPFYPFMVTLCLCIP